MAQTTHTTHPTTSPRTAIGWPSTLLAPAVVGAIGWLVADPLLGIDLQTGNATHPTSVTFPATVVVSLLAAAAGLGLLTLLRRRGHSVRTWTVIALVVLALSLLGPLGATTTAAGLALAALHLSVGTTVILAVRRAARRSA